MQTVKRIGVVVGALLVVAIGGVLGRFYLLAPAMRPAPEVKAPSTPEALARGEYLARSVTGCVGCHSPVQLEVLGEPIVDGKLLAGRDFGEFPGFPGRLRASNLTPDPEKGVGKWTDGELLRAIREGVSRDGRPLFPMMPYGVYSRTLSDDDALAIIAWLRTVPPVADRMPPSNIPFPISMFVRAAPKPLDKSPPPPPTAPLERGKWLLVAASCADCHTTADEQMNPLPGMELAGNNPFPIPDKGTVYTANITSDRETGIGEWSDEEVARAVFGGVSRSGRRLYGMPWAYYAGMTEEDKKALLLALRQVTPVKNRVRPNEMK